MRVNHIMLCDFAIPAEGQQKASIIGIFQAFNLPRLPFSVPRFFIVFGIEGQPSETGKFDVSLRLQDGDGRDVLRVDGRFEAPTQPDPGGTWTANHVIEAAGLKFEQPGGHQVIVLVNREVKATTRLEVNLVPQPQL